MVDISRRFFLGGALSVAAASVIPLQAIGHIAPVPRIYADLVNDDWEGLQALCDGKPFVCQDSLIRLLGQDDFVDISNGRFLISKPLRVTDRALAIQNSYFRATDDFDASTFLDIRNCPRALINQNTFDSRANVALPLSIYSFSNSTVSVGNA